MRLDLRNHDQRLGIGVVEVEDHQRRLFFTGFFEQLFVTLDELDAHVELARGFVDLGDEEKIVNEEKDSGRHVAVVHHGHKFSIPHGRWRYAGAVGAKVRAESATAAAEALAAATVVAGDQVAVDLVCRLLLEKKKTCRSRSPP